MFGVLLSEQQVKEIEGWKEHLGTPVIKMPGGMFAATFSAYYVDCLIEVDKKFPAYDCEIVFSYMCEKHPDFFEVIDIDL